MNMPDFRSESIAFAQKHNMQPAYKVQLAMEHAASLTVAEMTKEVSGITNDLKRAHNGGNGGEKSGTIPPLEKSEI